MKACKTVRKWITEEIRKPVEKWLRKAEESCREARRWVEREVRKPIERRRVKTERKCKKRKCKWYCACCNKWFCWLETIVERVIEWIVQIVGEWLVETICKIVVKVIKIIVEVVITIGKFIVVGFTCLFTYPRGAWDALIDFWYDVIDIIDDIGKLIKDIIGAISDLLDITKEFLLDLGDKFGFLGRIFAGLIAGILDILRRIFDGLGRIVDGIFDMITGILNLDFCSVLEGFINGIFFGSLQASLVTGAITFGASGSRDGFIRRSLRVWLKEQIEGRFDEKELIEEMEEKLRLDSTEFGIDWNVIPMRATISSRSREYSLSDMHENDGHPYEDFDLYEIAGYAPIGCKESPSTRTNYKLVYKDTDYRVDYADLRAYLAGEENIPEFVLIAGEYEVLRDMLIVAERKFRQMGIYLKWNAFETVELRQDEFLQSSSKVDLLADRITDELGLNDICDLPAVMVFEYEKDNSGIAAAWWLGEPRQATVATVRSNSVAHLFGTLLAHEMGHCFALCHSGHDGMEHIMFTLAEGGNNCGNIDPDHDNEGGDLDKITVKTLTEYLIMGGEPRFTLDDGKNAWTWILDQAIECIWEG